MAKSCMTNQIKPKLLSLTSNFLSVTFIFELVFPLLSNRNSQHSHCASAAIYFKFLGAGFQYIAQNDLELIMWVRLDFLKQILGMFGCPEPGHFL